ncbi:hypothetical protein MTP03_10280 [Tsukamurella sp. PLM1]|nr:hypothetical protein MTP03_10280 [Tsukamurella sp. PLM1]
MLSIAPFASRGLGRLSGELLPCVPGAEAAALADPALAQRLPDGAVILAGERLAEAPGALTAAAALATATGARLAWIPRRAGEPGAVAAGTLPGLLPGGRAVSDPAHRAEVEAVWGTAIPTDAGRDTGGILAAAAAGEVTALVCGAVDVADLPDPDAARRALDAAFVVSLEQRESEVTARADVVLPVATVVQRSGTFVDWEGRPGVSARRCRPRRPARRAGAGHPRRGHAHRPRLHRCRRCRPRPRTPRHRRTEATHRAGSEPCPGPASGPAPRRRPGRPRHLAAAARPRARAGR